MANNAIMIFDGTPSTVLTGATAVLADANFSVSSTNATYVEFDNSTPLMTMKLDGTSRFTTAASGNIGKTNWGTKHFYTTTDGVSHTTGPVYEYIRITPYAADSPAPPLKDPVNDVMTVTRATVVANPYYNYKLDSSSNAIALTLGDGDYLGQKFHAVMIDATNSSTITVENHETSANEVFTADAVNEYLSLEWDTVQWVTIKATMTV